MRANLGLLAQGLTEVVETAVDAFAEMPADL